MDPWRYSTEGISIALRVTPRGGRDDIDGIETLANGKVFEIGRVLVWEPPKRFVFSWRQANFPPDLETEVEVCFEAVGDETRVSVEHRGFDQVPAGAARHGFPDHALLARLGEWWQVLLRSVADRAS